jgi:hypothetical protein
MAEMTPKARQPGALVRAFQSILALAFVALIAGAFVKTGDVDKLSDEPSPSTVANAAADRPVAAEAVPEPTAFESAAVTPEPAPDPLKGVSFDDRQQVFAACLKSDANASELADSLFPSKYAPDDAESLAMYHVARDARCEAAQNAGRRTILRRFNITGDQLAAIEIEGRAQKWTLDAIAIDDTERVRPSSTMELPRLTPARGSRRARGRGGR